MQRRFCRRLVACCLQPTHLHNSGTFRLPSVAGGSNVSLFAAIRSVRQSRAESPFLPPTRGLLRAACCIFTTLAQPCFFVHLFLHIRLLGAFNSRACRGALQISGGHPCAIVVKRRESLGGAIVHILQTHSAIIISSPPMADHLHVVVGVSTLLHAGEAKCHAGKLSVCQISSINRND